MNGLRLYINRHRNESYFSFFFNPIMSELIEYCSTEPEWVPFPDEDKEIENINKKLKNLTIDRYQKEVFYKGEIFKEFLNLIDDDGNELFLFKKPYPDLKKIINYAIRAEKFYKAGCDIILSNLDYLYWDIYTKQEYLLVELEGYFKDNKDVAIKKVEYLKDYDAGYQY